MGAAVATAGLLVAVRELCGGSSAPGNFSTFQSAALLTLTHVMHQVYLC